MVKYLKQAQPQSRQDNRALSDACAPCSTTSSRTATTAVQRYAQRTRPVGASPNSASPTPRLRAARKAVSPVFKEDFAFCKKQVTDFAKRQRESLHEFEAEVRRRHHARAEDHPGRDGRLLHPRRQVSADLRRDHERCDREGRRRAARDRRGAAARRRKACFAPTLYALAESGADEIYTIGGVQAFASWPTAASACGRST